METIIRTELLKRGFLDNNGEYIMDDIRIHARYGVHGLINGLIINLIVFKNYHHTYTSLNIYTTLDVPNVIDDLMENDIFKPYNRIKKINHLKNKINEETNR